MTAAVIEETDTDLAFFEQMDWTYAPNCEASLLTGKDHDPCPEVVEWSVTLTCCGMALLFCDKDQQLAEKYQTRLLITGRTLSHLTGPRACGSTKSAFKFLRIDS